MCYSASEIESSQFLNDRDTAILTRDVLGMRVGLGREISVSVFVETYSHK